MSGLEVDMDELGTLTMSAKELNRLEILGRALDLRFAKSESTFDSFEATRPYLERHGKQSHSTATRRAFSGSPAQMCARTVA